MQEIEIARLQTALQALTAVPNADNQPAAAYTSFHHRQTGVFRSHSIPSAHTAAEGSALVGASPLQHTATRSAAKSGQFASHPHTTQQHVCTPQPFLYPEDTSESSKPYQGLPGSLQGRQAAQRTGMQQQQYVQQRQRLARPDKAQAYIVEEPESPHQPVTSEQQSNGGPSQSEVQSPQHIRRHVRAAQDPPAGCLYQDTTIRRTTTPSRKGKAWTHHEEITVRQIREIRQSEASTASLPPPNCPHVMQGSIVAQASMQPDDTTISHLVQPMQACVPGMKYSATALTAMYIDAVHLICCISCCKATCL